MSGCRCVWRQLELTLEKDCSHERSLTKNRAGHRASRGIGRASALALAKAGAQVVVHYGHGAKEADAVVAEIRTTGGRADVIATDLTAPDGAHTLAKRVRGIVGDRLDILVLNAGVSKAATIEDTTVEDFDHLFAVNVRAPFFLVQQLLPILRSGTSVVLLSSLAAHASVGTLLSAYTATKGAVDALVRRRRLEALNHSAECRRL